MAQDVKLCEASNLTAENRKTGKPGSCNNEKAENAGQAMLIQVGPQHLFRGTAILCTAK